MARFTHDGFITTRAIGASLVSLLLTACSNGLPDAPAPIAVAQCAADVCRGPAASIQPAAPSRLCPASLDYGTTFTGGAGSGEYIKIRLDTAKKQYEMVFVESPVPTSRGQVNETRTGLTIAGAYETADLYRVADAQGRPRTPFALPTAEQSRCSLVLKNGRTADGRYAVEIDPSDPPILFVGNGIVGGAVPGATVQFDGVELAPGITVGAVPRKTFDYYPFIAFSKTITDFSRIAGNYNELGIHFTPEGGSYQTSPDNPTPSALGWQVDGIQVSETLHADGSCTVDTAQSFAACPTTGTN
jgi:hypothetical protein